MCMSLLILLEAQTKWTIDPEQLHCDSKFSLLHKSLGFRSDARILVL